MAARCALVTGASRNLGAAIARRLGEDGWAVAVNYGKDDAAAAGVVEAVRLAGVDAEAFPFDVTEEAAVATGIEAVRTRLGDPLVVVNNATGPQPFISLEQQSWEDYLGQLDFFVKAPLLLLHATAPAMKEAIEVATVVIGRTPLEASTM